MSQDVERECAAACASLAMPMPLNVSLRALSRHNNASMGASAAKKADIPGHCLCGDGGQNC